MSRRPLVVQLLKNLGVGNKSHPSKLVSNYRAKEHADTQAQRKWRGSKEVAARKECNPVYSD